MDVVFSPTGPAQAPGPVTNVSATAGALQATVNWTAPTGGGSPSSYLVTPYIGSTAQTAVSVTAPASSKTITGLTGGTTYTFKVTAVNSVGPGPGVGGLERGHPDDAQPPAAPTGVSATRARFRRPSTGRRPPATAAARSPSYRVTPYIGATAQTPVSVEAPANSKTITGLTAGHGLHLQGRRDQRGRRRARLGPVELGDPDRGHPARGADRGHRDRQELRARS